MTRKSELLRPVAARSLSARRPRILDCWHSDPKQNRHNAKADKQLHRSTIENAPRRSPTPTTDLFQDVHDRFNIFFRALDKPGFSSLVVDDRNETASSEDVTS